MKKQCFCCGALTSPLEMSLTIIDGHILCFECIEEIIDDVNQIYENMPVEQFMQIKTKIKNTCNELLPEHVTERIIATINQKHNRTYLPYFTDDSGEKHPTPPFPLPLQKESFSIFNHIGHKIKVWAQAFIWIGIILSVISGLSIIFTFDDMVFAGVLIGIFGSLFSWISSFVLYGFGQLIENTNNLGKEQKKKIL